ncbi:MAG TPA: hypothetical protein VHR72_10345, partial [Gemmataceae bacterium]|nr:hypothetical protein [Gemmataceae bacterium]
FPSRVLHGHVKTVDTIASQQDWFASDVKVYKTMVSIDESIDGLKPGMSAEVTITADESSSEVLVVPVQSVIGTISSGAHRQCFVIDESGQPKLRDITVGMSNQREVEVKEGLKEGDRVVANPSPLLGEDSELHPGKARGKRDESADDAGDSGKKAKKKGPPPTAPSRPTAPTAPAGPAANAASPAVSRAPAAEVKTRN